MDVLGWIGSFAFAVMGIPQAKDCVVKGHARHINDLTLKLWLLGNTSMLVYVLVQPTILLPAILSHVVSTIFILIIMKYKFYPKAGIMTFKKPLSMD